MKNLPCYLHRLIHVLNKAQKRNFGKNLTANRNRHLKLFHFLNKQEVYDDEALKAFLEKNDMEASASKIATYLFDKLSEVNPLQTSGGDVFTVGGWVKDFDKRLERVKILCQLGETKEVLQEINKLKKKTKEYDYPALEIRIRDEESFFHAHTNFRFISYKEQVILNEEYIDTIKKHEYLVQHKQLYYTLRHYIDENTPKEVQKTIHRLDQINDKAYDTYYSKLFWYMSKSSYSLHTNDAISSKQVFEAFHKFLDEHTIYIKADYHTYFTQKSNLAMQEMNLVTEGAASVSFIVEGYKKITDNKFLAVQNILTQKKVRLSHKKVLIRLQLLAIYKETSLLDLSYLKEMETQLVKDEKQMLKEQKDKYFLASLLCLTFFKIILKEEESVMGYISFLKDQNIPKNNAPIFEFQMAIISLSYYYTFLDRRIFEVQLANFKRRKEAKGGEGIALIIGFFNTIKRDKYQRNRKNALEYYNLFKDFEKTNKLCVKVSFWLKWTFLDNAR